MAYKDKKYGRKIYILRRRNIEISEKKKHVEDLGHDVRHGYKQTDRQTDSGRVELAPIICSKRQPGHHYTYRASTHVQQLSDNQQRRLEAETTHEREERLQH